ncbi:MAG: dihydrofolate reductase family protein [Actinomycetes bacterium]
MFTYSTGSSLDGFVADAHGGLDWLLSVDHDPEGPGGFAAFDARIGALVMGRSTYDWVEAELDRTGMVWPHRQPTWVLTHREPPVVVPDAPITFTDAPIDAVATAMRAAAGARDCWIVGGGQVATGFATAGLLDEVIVAIAPVLLGAGTPIITTHLDLALVSAERNGGLAVLSYRVRRG